MENKTETLIFAFGNAMLSHNASTALTVYAFFFLSIIFFIIYFFSD